MKPGEPRPQAPRDRIRSCNSPIRCRQAPGEVGQAPWPARGFSPAVPEVTICLQSLMRRPRTRRKKAEVRLSGPVASPACLIHR
jgi:hypothetical protein